MYRQMVTGILLCFLMALQVAHAQVNFEMVSLTTADVPPIITPSGSSSQAAVTSDGRYVVFEGSYGGLVTSPVVSGSNSQIYLRDRVAGTTELISQSTAGVPSNSNNNNNPTISNDGCRVAFESWSNNLIDGYTFDFTSSSHVYLRDRCAVGGPTTTQVDVMPNGGPALEQAQEPRISGDGRTVAFISYSDLVDGLLDHNGNLCTGSPGPNVVYLRHLDSNTTTALTRPDGGCIAGAYPDISYDGTRIAFWAYDDLLNASSGMWQIYLFDTSIGPSSLRYVSAAANGVPQKQTDGIHQGEGTSTGAAPAISQDGRMVAFRSRGHGLWPSPLPLEGDGVVSQVYVKDTATGAIGIASVDSTGTVLGNGNSSGYGGGYRPGLSADGQYIVFRTEATNIASASETGSGFVIHNNVSGKTSGLTNTATNGYPELSPSGRFLTINSGNYLDPRFTDRGMFLVDTTISGPLTTRYRLYSDFTKEHLYTTDANEYGVLATRGWKAEGSIYRLFKGAGSIAGVNAVPYYRLYNAYSYQHHWTTDANEYESLGGVGWSKEGIDGYVLPTQATDSVPLYRLYLNANGGLHLWTTDANEKTVLTTSQGWKDEGVAGYVLPLQ